MHKKLNALSVVYVRFVVSPRPRLFRRARIGIGSGNRGEVVEHVIVYFANRSPIIKRQLLYAIYAKGTKVPAPYQYFRIKLKVTHTVQF